MQYLYEIYKLKINNKFKFKNISIKLFIFVIMNIIFICI